MFGKLKSLIKHLSKHWMTVGFVVGFIGDYLLLNKVDDLFDNLILVFYVLLSTISLWLFYVGAAERVPEWLAKRLVRFAPMVMQYSFGGLLSGMLIFYGRSGDLLANAPYLILILLVILGNEFLTKRSDRLVYHLALYFIGLFSLVVLEVPVVIGKMGDGIFILSGFIALSIVIFVVQVLFRIVPHFMAINTTRVVMVIGFLYVGLNTLYFTNVIPPIPLSLTELSIVQSVERLDDKRGYRIVYEKQPWQSLLPFYYQVIHPTGPSIACFARVFAPTNMETEIYHRWEYKDANGVWQQQFRFPYPIFGSNDQGYRGYTILQNQSAGWWRCSVETKRGQVLGRTVVRIEKGTPEKLTTVIE